jgi:branched-chain amino acid transport system substrate-binding protein
MSRVYRSVLFSLAIAVAHFSALAEEQPPIKIGVVGPFTGKSSEDMGESIRGGARVFLNEINQMGGLLGRRVELIERDDQAKPELGVQIAHELTEKEKVTAAVGYANTGVALPSAKVFQDAKVPLIVSGATGATITTSFLPPIYPASYIFRTSASDALQPIVILNDLIDRRKIQKIALLHDETPYGQYGKQSVVAEMDRRKLSPVVIESFKIGDQDMTAQVTRAKQAGADAIVLYTLASEAAAVTRTAAKLNFKVPIVGSWILSHKGYIEQSAGAAEGARTAVTYIETEMRSVNNGFVLAYKKVNNVNQIPAAVAAAQTYDALRLIAAAVFQANSFDSVKIREALEDLKRGTTSTVVSRYTRPFTPTDHEAISLNMIVMGEIHKGQVRYAYAEDANRGMIARLKK